MYLAILLIRRSIYIIVPLCIPNLPLIFQLTNIYYLSFMTLIYYGYSAPLKSRLDRRFDIVNEFMVGLCCLSLFPLTDWNQDPELKFNYSWLLISLMQILIVINIFNVFRCTYKSINLLAKKYRIQFYIDNAFRVGVPNI